MFNLLNQIWFSSIKVNTIQCNLLSIKLCTWYWILFTQPRYSLSISFSWSWEHLERIKFKCNYLSSSLSAHLIGWWPEPPMTTCMIACWVIVLDTWPMVTAILSPKGLGESTLGTGWPANSFHGSPPMQFLDRFFSCYFAVFKKVYISSI